MVEHETFTITRSPDSETCSRYFIAVTPCNAIGPVPYMGVSTKNVASVGNKWFASKGSARSAFAYDREEIEAEFPNHYMALIEIGPRSTERILHSLFHETFTEAYRSPLPTISWHEWDVPETKPEHPETGTW